MTQRWRLIAEQLPSEGARHMALDRAIQCARDAGAAPPTLRIYTWRRPTLTLGKFQDVATVNLAACERHGVEVVRRFTGGRGVIHDDEVTYSVVAAVADGIPRGTAASYEHLSSALIEACARLGLYASLTRRVRGTSVSGACYLHTSMADLSLGQRKLSGSAQVWLNETVLQHGSFVIERDVCREAEIFGLNPEQRSELVRTSATLADGCGGEPPSRLAIREAIIEGFAEGLGVEFDDGVPTDAEEAAASRILSNTQLVCFT